MTVRGFDIAVIGAGLVGSAIAYGLAKRGCRTLLLDEGDVAFRAARGNFGLVWVQSKGLGAPHYQAWTMDAARDWPDFAEELRAASGIDVQHRRPGGVHLCLSGAEFLAREALMAQLQAQAPDRFCHLMLREDELRDLLPGIGPEVVGGSFTPLDGHCDPLRLLRALHAAFMSHGGSIVAQTKVEQIIAEAGTYRLVAASASYECDKLAIAAGLGGAALAQQIGIAVDIRPLRGQIMITERLPRLLDLPTTSVRQTGDGTIQLGDSQEDVGLDNGTTMAVMRDIAARAQKSFPALAQAQVVRAWGALRVMTPDGLPVYQESPQHAGAYFCTCHSGVTLAPVHAGPIAAWIAGAGAPPDAAFSATRFATPDIAHVPFA